MKMRTTTHIGLLFTAMSPLVFTQCCKEQKPLNVLFIMVDDLRPELGIYGQSHMKTPNIDALAEGGVIFDRSYCNIPVSGASRASLMTGLYGTQERFLDYFTRATEDVPTIPTIGEHLKNCGYNTYSFGKIFHHPDDKMESWSEEPQRPDYPNDIHTAVLRRDYQSPELAHLNKKKLPDGAIGPAWESPNVEDDAYFDGKITNLAISKLGELASSDKPFFLALGFYKPHLPFNAPKKYWDMYDTETIEVAPNPNRPEGVCDDPFHPWGELRGYTNIGRHITHVEDDMAREIRHAYYAAISYIDAQVGKVIAALKDAGLADNTMIVLLGDHGWSLGEHDMWCKTTTFDNVMRVPLIINVPDHKSGVRRSESLVSYVDLYPTLCELTGVETPSHLQGRSLCPILDNTSAKVNDYLFCRWRNGEAIVSSQYNLTEFMQADGSTKEMMFDRKNDPQENYNVAYDGRYEDVAKKLREELHSYLQQRQ